MIDDIRVELLLKQFLFIIIIFIFLLLEKLNFYFIRKFQKQQAKVKNLFEFIRSD